MAYYEGADPFTEHAAVLLGRRHGDRRISGCGQQLYECADYTATYGRIADKVHSTFPVVSRVGAYLRGQTPCVRVCVCVFVHDARPLMAWSSWTDRVIVDFETRKPERDRWAMTMVLL